MKRFARTGGLVAAAICVAWLSACSAVKSDPPAHSAAAAAPYPPPPMRAEIPSPARSADSLWLVGHWNWDGARYAWTPGHYVQRPTPTANWLPGYWEQGSGGWVWTEGHWQS
jgi:YXWGXW repeat-containing protein